MDRHASSYPALPRKIIRDAAWLVAADEAGQTHCYRRDVDLAIEGETIAAIDRPFVIGAYHGRCLSAILILARTLT